MDKNSLLYWYPRIKDLGIKVPLTEIVKLTQSELEEYYSGQGDSCSVKRLTAEVEKVVSERFKLPIFLRTDMTSNKHFWDKSCYVKTFDNLNMQIFELICFNMLADFMGPLPIEALVVREFIPMDTYFHAFAGNMPVNRERRYFIRDGRVLCHHPYWIEESIRKPLHKELPENWKELLREANTETDLELETLRITTEKVAKAINGFWSVDYCFSVKGEWILIDMAVGEKSWHPENCEFAIAEVE